MLAYSPNACNTQSWLRSKLGAWNLTWGSLMLVTGSQILEPPSDVFPVLALAEVGWEAEYLALWYGMQLSHVVTSAVDQMTTLVKYLLVYTLI